MYIFNYITLIVEKRRTFTLHKNVHNQREDDSRGISEFIIMIVSMFADDFLLFGIAANV